MAISVEYIELRRAPRSGAQAPVGYRLAAGPRHQAVLTDIAPGGAGLLLDRPLSPDQALEIDGLDGGARRARVRWITKLRDGFRIGVQFEPSPHGG